MRYVVLEVDLPDDHPNWPNERVYKILDLKTNNTSFSCFTKREIAERVAQKKNESN